MVTSEKGEYRVQVPPGVFTLRLEAEAFRPYSRGGVAVADVQSVRVNVELLPQTDDDSGAIMCVPPTIDIGSTSTGISVGSGLLDPRAFVRAALTVSPRWGAAVSQTGRPRCSPPPARRPAWERTVNPARVGGSLIRPPMLQASPLPARPRLEHVVRLYEGAEALAGEVASFALQGVREGSAVLVIATREHAPLFREAMQRRGLAVASLEGVGQLRFVEAEGLLEQFCPGGVLDRARFTELLGALIETGQARFGRVRAFGEMVNLLWSRGERTTALALEECWDGLIASTSLGLLCAYDLRGSRVRTTTRRSRTSAPRTPG